MKNNFNYELAILSVGTRSKEQKGGTQTGMHTSLFIIINNNQKVEIIQVFTYRWKNKQNMLNKHHAVLFGFFLKKEMWIHATTWTYLEGILLSKIS